MTSSKKAKSTRTPKSSGSATSQIGNTPVALPAAVTVPTPAIEGLLKEDLARVTSEQEKAARKALEDSPRDITLISAVKQWARALADVCRSHAGRCAQVHANSGHQDPAEAAMKVILRTLYEHLCLPTDGTRRFDDWPEPNIVSNFVLDVSGAPIDDKQVITPTLPRWEPESRFARRIANLSGDRSKSPFLSVKKSQKNLRALEELFRNALWDGLETSISEAVLASWIAPLSIAAGEARRGQTQSAPSPQGASSGEAKLVFTRKKGKTFVEGKVHPAALLNTRNAFTETLAQVRVLVAQKNGKVSINELKNVFGGTELAKAAEDADWDNWIEIFSVTRPTTAKNAALVFLEKKTPLQRSTIEKYCSEARNSRK